MKDQESNNSNMTNSHQNFFFTKPDFKNKKYVYFWASIGNKIAENILALDTAIDHDIILHDFRPTPGIYNVHMKL